MGGQRGLSRGGSLHPPLPLCPITSVARQALYASNAPVHASLSYPARSRQAKEAV